MHVSEGNDRIISELDHFNLPECAEDLHILLPYPHQPDHLGHPHRWLSFLPFGLFQDHAPFYQCSKVIEDRHT